MQIGQLTKKVCMIIQNLEFAIHINTLNMGGIKLKCQVGKMCDIISF